VSDDLDHDANVFGALALFVADRMADAFAATGEAVSPAAALSALNQLLDRPSIDIIARAIGLTSSGTVRLVDKLEAAGFVTRGPGANDKRATTIALTRSGREAAERIAAARLDVVRDALATLDPADRDAFERIGARLLVALMRGPGATRWMCRLCDTDACGRSRGLCPVYNESLARFGPNARPWGSQGGASPRRGS
jgi:DNA-binding MarR family transcriptional regulator